MAGDDVHREIGIDRFNATWDLIDKGAARTSDDDVEMLLSAVTSRWHWGRVGGPEEIATGEWQVAHTAALLGLGDLAVLFAQRSLAVATEQGWTGWRLASAHEGLARAYATLGDPDLRAFHLDAADAALATEPDAEESVIMREQLATVPRV
jgi:hypothetical protein